MTTVILSINLGPSENVKLVLTLNAKLPFTQQVPWTFFPGVKTCTTPITSTYLYTPS
jgi:hypothetical protein